MSKYKTIDVWNRVFGAKQEAYDYTGRLMKKSACGNPRSAYHPTLDHIRPLSAGGCDVPENIIICHRDTNEEKSRSLSALESERCTLPRPQRKRLPCEIRDY